LEILQQIWGKTPIRTFSTVEDLRVWQGTGNTGAAVKVIYDKAAGEVHVLGRWKGRTFDKTFLVEQDLESTLKEAKAFIHEQTGVNREIH
jgi:hypothetical protein